MVAVVDQEVDKVEYLSVVYQPQAVAACWKSHSCGIGSIRVGEFPTMLIRWNGPNFMHMLFY